MELNNKYKISTKEIGSLYKMIKNNELIYDPFYQRNFVWELKHQIKFIETIILGYPCPEIFIAEGELDLETHTKYIHVIDGQQRVTTIKNFLSDKLVVRGKKYSEMTKDERTAISNYEIATVTLKMNPERDIEEIEEIFRRLNNNKYALNETEKTISILSNNNFVILARLFSGDLFFEACDDELDNEKKNRFRENPFIEKELKEWALDKNFEYIHNFFEKNIYSIQQIKGNYPTKDIIDLMGIIIKNHEIHSRILNEDEIVELTEKVYSNREFFYFIFKESLEIIQKIKMPIVVLGKSKKKKYFFSRGIIFSLLQAFAYYKTDIKNIDLDILQNKINQFAENLPSDFIEASRNSVMDRKQRQVRFEYFKELIGYSIKI